MEPTFDQKVTVALSLELSKAEGDAERMGALIERLARCLGLAVAVACRGNGEAIDEMMAGAEGYAHSEAVEKAKFARMMAGLRP